MLNLMAYIYIYNNNNQYVDEICVGTRRETEVLFIITLGGKQLAWNCTLNLSKH